MRISYTREHGGAYVVFPVNSRGREYKRGEFAKLSTLVQTDWDFPGLARSFGWNGKIGRERCEHRGTDGTIKCPDCGRGVGQFISAARDYLDNHEGKTVEDPGYVEVMQYAPGVSE